MHIYFGAHKLVNSKPFWD